MQILTAEVRRMRRSPSHQEQFHAPNRQLNKAKDQISRNARHAKTPDDLPDEGDLPIAVLRKEIPATEVHDM